MVTGQKLNNRKLHPTEPVQWPMIPRLPWSFETWLPVPSAGAQCTNRSSLRSNATLRAGLRAPELAHRTESVPAPHGTAASDGTATASCRPPAHSAMQDLVRAGPLPRACSRARGPVPQSPFYLGEPGGNPDTLERSVQRSLYSDCAPGSEHTPLSSSKCYPRERQASAGVESRVPQEDFRFMSVS